MSTDRPSERPPWRNHLSDWLFDDARQAEVDDDDPTAVARLLDAIDARFGPLTTGG